MAKTTPATLALRKAGVAFTLHTYDYDPDAGRVGLQAAESLGADPARVRGWGELFRIGAAPE